MQQSKSSERDIIYIDEVRPPERHLDGVDVFEIEWFEIHKRLFHRLTLHGVELHLLKESNRNWQQGDGLYRDGELIAQITIKPAMTIQFSTTEDEELVDFVYYVGNRHLPVFFREGDIFFVPYDGNLYEQLLSKFGSSIMLIKQQLLADNLLKKTTNKSI